MGSSAKGQSFTLAGSKKTALTVQKEKLRELSSAISMMGLEAGILADLLESKVNNAKNDEDLTTHLYFTAQVLKRFEQKLIDAEGDINTIERG